MYRDKHNSSLTALLEKTVEKRGHEKALEDEKTVVDYIELAEKVKSLASTLLDEGLQPGDRVSFLFPNSIDYAIVHYAVMSAGGVSVPLDSFISPKNLSFQVTDTEARFFLFDSSRLGTVMRAQLPRFQFVASNDTLDDSVESFFSRKVIDLNQLYCRKGEVKLPRVSPSHHAMILYTTGTTGRQKGVILTHCNLVVSAMNIMERCEVTEDDCELTALPLTRLFGLAHVHGYLSLGARMVLVKDFILPQNVLPLIEAKRATSFPNVPTAFYMLMDRYPQLLQRYGNQLRYILMCSAPCKPERYSQLKKILSKVRIFHSYGLTEAARSTIIELDKHQDRLTSVGTPTFGTNISILQDGKLQEPNVEGEVVLRGPIVTQGYWKRPDENERAFCEYGFRTGDLGYLDEEGFLYIVGRIKDIINVSGHKVNPMEIEEVLKEFPGIKDVAVVGVPDDEGSFNEKIVAFYTTKDGAEITSRTLRSHCYDHLEKHKVPLCFKLVKEIPKTVSGKTQRFRLLESYLFSHEQNDMIPMS